MKSLRNPFAWLGLFLLALHGSARAEPVALQVGKTYHGFKLVREQRVEEIDALGRLFVHARTGARLLKFEADDNNRSFDIAFKTPPGDDTGVPHILEHCVLNGSRKFPVKSPFEILIQGSLNTFINAMTSSDFTMYPVASTNEKDFFNLMDIYLDAVLHPNIYDEPKIFQQEGWHFSLKDKDADLEYNGIVYNEMKGSFSSPNRVLYYVLGKNLFPDSPYGKESGGTPAAIPDLTRKQFLDFHRKYYHPSNSYITLWGDGDTLKELAFIHDNYLKRFKRKKVVAAFPLQKPFKELREVEAEYPVASTEKTEGKTFLALSFVAGEVGDPGLSVSLDVLSDVLVNLPAAPLRKALTDAGIGKDVSASYGSYQQGVFTITVKNADAADKDKFKKTVFEALGKVVEAGLSKKDIEGVINKMEFRLREADFGTFPKGLAYTFYSLRTWMFADDPFLRVAYEKPLAEVRKALTENHLEALIQKHLIDNPHALLAVVAPKPGLEQEIEAKLKKKLADIKAKLSASEIDKLVVQTKALKTYQETPDKPEDIKKIPMLALADLDREAERFDVLEKQVGGVKVVHFPVSTNGIIYLRLLFDASVVPQEMVPHLPLLTYLLKEVDTAKFSYGEINTEVNIHTGGLHFGVTKFIDVPDGQAWYPKVSVSGKVLIPKFPKLLELSEELINRTRFDDRRRLREVLTKLDARLQAMARNAGLALAAMRLGSYIAPDGVFDELTGGLSYIRFVSELVRDFDARADELSSDLQWLASLVFNRQNLFLGVTCSDEDYKTFEQHVPAFLAKLSDRKLKTQAYTFAAEKKNEGLVAASKVQYVAQGANFRQLGHTYSGKLDVLDQILSRFYLLQKIRIEGGAYGAGSSFARDGTAFFYSYRDPHLKKTLDNYKSMIEYLKSFAPSEREMTRFIIGTIARKDKPKTPSLKGRIALNLYMQKVRHEDRQKERDEILSTSKEEIRKLASLVGDVLSQNLICVYGNEKKLEENKGLFGELVKVVD